MVKLQDFNSQEPQRNPNGTQLRENNYFWAKTSYFSQTIHYKRPKLPGMTKVLQSTFTYKIWMRSDKKMMTL